MDPVQVAEKTVLVHAWIYTKTCSKFTLWSLQVCIICIQYSYLSWFFMYEYILYSYAVKYLETNTFHIRIRSGSYKRINLIFLEKWIYLIFVFKEIFFHEYICLRIKSRSSNSFYTGVKYPTLDEKSTRQNLSFSKSPFGFSHCLSYQFAHRHTLQVLT